MSFDRSLTRGPLPASVYWRRRAAVLGILLLLIIGITRFFGGGGNDEAATVKPASSAASLRPVVPEHIGARDTPASPSPAAATGSSAPSAPAASTPATLPPPVTAVLPTPTGRCSDDDVTVAAEVGRAEATRTVSVLLTFKTNVSAACLWEYGPKSVQVEITSGSDRIWSSLQCPKAITKRTLTLRRDTPVTVPVAWNSRRSDETCSTRTQWALPGYYHAQVAALGGEPSDIQFRLTKPTPVVPTNPAPSKAAGGTSTQQTPPKNPTNPKTKAPRAEPTGTPVRPD